MVITEKKLKKKVNIELPEILLFIYIIIWIVLAFNPVDRLWWGLENIVVFIFFPLLILSYRKFRLSNFSYFLIFIFAVLHAIGAHYTYSQTPIGYWLEDIFNFQRNHYDRIVHFLYGLLLTGVIAELFGKYMPSNKFIKAVLIFSLVFAIGSLYEVGEFVVSVVFVPGDADWLGTQGDFWDTQKDMSLQALGIILRLFFLIFFNSPHKWKQNNIFYGILAS